MSIFKTIKQDVRSEIGPNTEIDGSFDEISRLAKRIESGNLSMQQERQERAELVSEASQLARKLETRGMPNLADLLMVEARGYEH